MPRKITKNPLNQAILKTLAYEAVFKYPLSYYQLWNNLNYKGKYIKKDFDREIKNFVKKGYIKKLKTNQYTLPGIKCTDWNKCLKISKIIINKNAPAIKYVSKIPWIRLIAVTGDVASYSADERSDLDIFIITQKNRTWLTRALTWLTLKVLKKYPSSDGECDKFCPNLYVSEDSMSWINSKRNLYTAHNIISMQPIFDRKDTYLKFIEKNNWVFKYFPNFSVKTNTEIDKNTKLSSFLFDLIEKFFRYCQFRYMRKKITTENIEEKIIHFNKNDNSKRIIDEYNRILKLRKIS